MFRLGDGFNAFKGEFETHGVIIDCDSYVATHMKKRSSHAMAETTTWKMTDHNQTMSKFGLSINSKVDVAMCMEMSAAASINSTKSSKVVSTTHAFRTSAVKYHEHLNIGNLTPAHIGVKDCPTHICTSLSFGRNLNATITIKAKEYMGVTEGKLESQMAYAGWSGSVEGGFNEEEFMKSYTLSAKALSASNEYAFPNINRMKDFNNYLTRFENDGEEIGNWKVIAAEFTSVMGMTSFKHTFPGKEMFNLYDSQIRNCDFELLVTGAHLAYVVDKFSEMNTSPDRELSASKMKIIDTMDTIEDKRLEIQKEIYSGVFLNGENDEFNASHIEKLVRECKQLFKSRLSFLPVQGAIEALEEYIKNCDSGQDPMKGNCTVNIMSVEHNTYLEWLGDYTFREEVRATSLIAKPGKCSFCIQNVDVGKWVLKAGVSLYVNSCPTNDVDLRQKLTSTSYYEMIPKGKGIYQFRDLGKKRYIRIHAHGVTTVKDDFKNMDETFFKVTPIQSEETN